MTLDEIEKLIKTATSGPWISGSCGEWISIFSRPNSTDQCVIARIDNRISMRPITDEDWDNATFIASMRSLAPLMLKVCRAAKEVKRITSKEVNPDLDTARIAAFYTFYDLVVPALAALEAAE